MAKSHLTRQVSLVEPRKHVKTDTQEQWNSEVYVRQCVFHSVLLDKRAKIQKLKVYQDMLMESLGDVLENNAPLPQNESSASRKKKVQICGTDVMCFMIVCAFGAMHMSKFVLSPLQCCLSSFILFQNIELGLNENLISLNEILEVSFHAPHNHSWCGTNFLCLTETI